MKTAVLLLGIRFHLKTAYAFQLKRPKKAIWQRFTKKWIVLFEKASFRDSGGFRGGVPTQLQVYIRHCESGYRWRRWPLKMWRLSVTNYRFRCLGGVECICSVDYRKRKKKACDFKLERIRTENKRGMSDWTKIFRFFFEGKMNTFESKVEYLEPKATLNAYQ